jgi:hypothetical protein
MTLRAKSHVWCYWYLFNDSAPAINHVPLLSSPIKATLTSCASHIHIQLGQVYYNIQDLFLWTQHNRHPVQLIYWTITRNTKIRIWSKPCFLNTYHIRFDTSILKLLSVSNKATFIPLKDDKNHNYNCHRTETLVFIRNQHINNHGDSNIYYS